MGLIMSQCSGTYYCGVCQSKIVYRPMEWTTKITDDTKTGIGGIRDPKLFLSKLVGDSMEDERNLSMLSQWFGVLSLLAGR